MDLTVYRGGPGTTNVIQVDERSRVVRKLMGEDVVIVEMDFRQAEDLDINDYVTVEGRNYYLNSLPDVEKKSSRNFAHEVQFEALHYDLAKVQYLDADQNGEFFYNGDLNGFLTLLCSNMNRDLGGWTKGTIDATDKDEYRNLHFQGQNCLEVMNTLAEEFSCEFDFATKSINMRDKIETATIQTLGYYAGLKNIKRVTETSGNLITRLYAFGSERNILNTYRGGKRRLQFATQSKLEKNTTTYGVIEATEIFDEVYPHRTGTITSVSTSSVLDVVDSAMPFNLNNYLLPGLKAKFHFQTGNLAGYEFEIDQYTSTNKTFTLIEYKERYLDTIPNNTLKPAVGDRYVLLDITMPTTYITAAESLLRAKAQSLLDDRSDPTNMVAIEVETDWHYLRENSITFDIGQKIAITDTDLDNMSSRVVGYEAPLSDPYNYQLELADEVAQGMLRTAYNKASDAEKKQIQDRVGDVSAWRHGWYIERGENTGRTWATDSGTPGHYKRIKIDGKNNKLSFYDSNNIEVLKIDDSIVGSAPGIYIRSSVSGAVPASLVTIREDNNNHATMQQSGYQWVSQDNSTNSLSGFYAYHSSAGDPGRVGNRHGVNVNITVGTKDNAYGVKAVVAGSTTGSKYSGYFDGGDFFIKLGDTAGANALQLDDSGGNQMFKVNSDGYVYGPTADHWRFYLPDAAGAYQFIIKDSGGNNVFDVDSDGIVRISSGLTTGALVLRQMTTAQRDALSAVNGMIIYNTTTGVIEAYESGAWVNI